MDAIDRLKRDHRLLRSKLSMLQGAIALAPDSGVALREGCITLAHRLREHREREATVIALCQAAGHGEELGEELARVTIEHGDRLQLLQMLTRRFAKEDPSKMPKEFYEALKTVVEGLGEELHLQEDALFPLLAWGVRGRREEVTSDAWDITRPILSEEMTAHGIVSQHPETKPVFARHWINLAYEGYDSLGEVAWRHGMQPEELLGYVAQELSMPPVPAGPGGFRDSEKEVMRSRDSRREGRRAE